MQYKTLLSRWHTDGDTGFRLRHVRSNTEHFKLHDHDYYEIFLVLRGSASHLVGEERITACEGDLIFVRDFDIHDYADCSSEGFEFLNLAFTRENLDAVVNFLDCHATMQRLVSAPLPPVRRLSEEETERLHLKLASLLTSKASTAHARRILADILIDFFISDAKEDTAIPYWLKNAYEKMRAPKNFLLGTPRFFELCDRTREHATRALSLHYGVTPSEYVAGLKLSYAEGLLRNSTLTVSEIAYRSGFNNLSSFYTRFYKKHGTSPKDYRKES